VKSTWWPREINPLRRPLKRSNGRLKKRWHGPNILPGNSTRGRGIMACRMTQGHRRMNPWMGLLQGSTTQSSTHNTGQTEKDSETGHNQSVRKSVKSSTKGSRFIACQPTMPWPRVCSSINSCLIYPKISKRLTHMSSTSRRC
jgi:hypothetical protein